MNAIKLTLLKKELSEPETKKEAQSHAFSKDDYILTLKKQLEDQQKQFDEVLKSKKDETIDSLKETIATSKHAYEDMKDQLMVKDNQITALTKLTNNAQTLNLVDKDPKRLQTAQGNAETSSEQSNSEKEEDSSPKETSKIHWWQRFGKH